MIETAETHNRAKKKELDADGRLSEAQESALRVLVCTKLVVMQLTFLVANTKLIFAWHTRGASPNFFFYLSTNHSENGTQYVKLN